MDEPHAPPEELVPAQSPEPVGRRITARRLSLLGTLFVVVVIAIVLSRHALFIPLYLGLVTWAKVALKALTPKLALLVLKNGLVIKARDIVMDVGTRFLVTSHRPWRQRLLAGKRMAIDVMLALFRRYLAAALWLRCLIALVLLTLTASSTWAVFALLIVPQPIIDWLRQRVLVVLNKLGVLKSLDAFWRLVMPAGLRARWDRYRTWTLARRQLRAARELRTRLAPRLAVPIGTIMNAPLLARLHSDPRSDLAPASTDTDTDTDTDTEADTDAMIAYRLLDYTAADDAATLVNLLDGYAQDPMGGGAALPASTRERLASVLAATPGAFSIVAERASDDGVAEPLGLANCFTTVSTFAARPLINIHDLYVVSKLRGQGIGRGLLQAVERRALRSGACKVTLEVLEGNTLARTAYERFGFSGYALDDSTGHALFWQKTLPPPG